MYPVNRSEAPDSFVSAIRDAIKHTEELAQQELRLNSMPTPLVEIIDELENPPEIDPDNTAAALLEQVEAFRTEARLLFAHQALKNHTRGSYLRHELKNELETLILALTTGSEIDADLSLLQLRKDIGGLVKDLSELRSSPDRLPPDLEQGIDQLVAMWETIRPRIARVQFPIIYYGFYNIQTNLISICYKTVRESIDPAYVNELGAVVLAHEYFHALHFQLIREVPENLKKWDGKAGEGHIHRSAVVEGLASYFTLVYAKRYLSPVLVRFVQHDHARHPFPNWGYSGARLIERMSEGGVKSSFLSGMFHSSIIDLDVAYKLYRI